MYQHAIKHCTDGHEFMLGWDQARKHDDRSKFLHDVFFEGNFEAYEKNKIERLGPDAATPHRSTHRKLTRD